MKKLSLGKRILIGLVVGLIIGIVSPRAAEILSPIGDIFIRLLKMLIVPLVFFSITAGICKMGDVKQLRTVGLRFVLYIILTSGLCAVLGVVVGLVTNIGAGTTEFLDESAEVAESTYNFIDNVVSWFPTNIIESMSNANMLQIIVFCLFLGVALLVLGDKTKGIVRFIDQGNEVMLKITEFVMDFSPFGIASLIATMVTTITGATMKEVIALIVADNVTCIIVLFVLYPILIKFMAKISVVKYAKKIVDPLLVALTTTSSAATLPVSIKTADEKLGIPENIYGFTLPLGNTCGMNGFAVFIGLICVFVCHLYGVPVTFARVAQFVFLGIILSIGAAGVKGAGVVMSTVLMETIGMPLAIIPILAAIWPTIDPAHTTLNNVSDITGTTVIARQMGTMDMDVFNKD